MNDESSGGRGSAGERPRGAEVRGLFYLRDWKLLPTDGLGALSVAEVRAIDRIAIERYGVPSLLLMERAALGLEVVALEMLRSAGGSALTSEQVSGTGGSTQTSEQVSPAVVILCGPGSNGGDGFALGRLLLDRGIAVAAHITPGAGASGDAAVNRAMFERFAGRVVEGPPQLVSAPALVVDALFGTGLSRAIEGPAAELVAWANRMRAAGALTLAVDIPSGIDGETGEPLGPAIEADSTVTLVAAKPGLLTPAGRARCGRIVVAPIGIEGILAQSAG